MNAYDLACSRMDTARRRCQRARRLAERIVREADQEYDLADANLARYETRPGVPRPEYRIPFATAREATS